MLFSSKTSPMLRCVVPGMVNGVVGIDVGVRISAVAEVTRVVVVEQVVVAGIAIGIDLRRQRLEIIHDRGHAGLGHIGAVRIASAAVDPGGCAVVSETAVAVL